MSKAIVRVQAKYRPISGDVIGYRLQAAIPNTAGRKMVHTSKGLRATDQEVPAFRKPYLIDESMDHAYLGAITEADVERFAKKLEWAGYTQFEPAEAVDPTSEAARIYDDFAILSQ